MTDGLAVDGIEASVTTGCSSSSDGTASFVIDLVLGLDTRPGGRDDDCMTPSTTARS